MTKHSLSIELDGRDTLEIKKRTENKLENNDDGEYDEEEDDDYDPMTKENNETDNDSDEDNADEKRVDYSAIEAGFSQVKTRSQIKQDKYGSKNSSYKNSYTKEGLLQDTNTGSDIDAIFNDLKTNRLASSDDWMAIIGKESEKPKEIEKRHTPTEPLIENKKIKISSSYTFAGKVVTDTKYVDADSAEAKAYLNSTSAIAQSSEVKPGSCRSFVPVIREIPGTKETVELKIKLKRPSLIDKFLAAQNNKNQKLSTLEKSRLDWASFVDQNKIKDELIIGNKAGYLKKQDFLGRLQEKRDEQYQRAKEEDKAQRWRLSQQ